MEIQVTQEVIDTVCNSLRSSRQSLRTQLRTLSVEHQLGSSKRTVIEQQIKEVEEALAIFENLN